MNKSRILVYRFFLFLILLIFLPQKYIFFNTIQLFLQPAPQNIQLSVKKELHVSQATQKLEKLNTISTSHIGKKLLKNGIQNHFKAILPKINGFVALYGGYVDFSDTQGNISFPLLHDAPKIYITITPSINLKTIYGQTISHREIIAQEPISNYLLERKETEINKTKTTYWQISEKPIDENKKINPLSIILLTKPKNLVVPLGAFITENHINLVLPNLYVVGNIDQEKAILNFLDIRRYFEPIKREEKKEKETILLNLIENN